MPTSLFRFTSFQSFVDVVQRKELAFVTYDMWQDPYEGFVIRALQTVEGRQKVIEWLTGNTKSQMPPEVRCSTLQIFCKTVHLQSWTRCAESDALWRIYSYDNHAIRIETSVKKINRLQDVTGFPVEYKPMSLEQELKRVFVRDDMRLQEVFASKRKAFAHEMEYRLMSHMDGRFLPQQEPTGFNPFGQPETWDQLLAAEMISREERDTQLANLSAAKKISIKGTKYVSIAHISDFIESVMVHPQAAEWFVETVNQYCKANNIPFKGRSSLYTFSHR